MKLGRKNLVYSLILAGIMMLFLIGYFIYMLPSLYVDHITEQNLKSIREQHRAYVENRSYENVQVRNFTACFSIEIPKEGNSVLIAGKAFSAEIIIRDERLYGILERCRRDMEALESSWGKEKEGEENGGTSLSRDRETKLREEMEKLVEIFRESIEENDFLPVEIKLLHQELPEEVYFGESMKPHYYSDGVVIMEANISDTNNQYTNYIAMEETRDSIIISYLPVVTPQMDEIRPVVLQSLPMLGAVLLLMVLLFSQMYSKGIVTPVVDLVRHTEAMKSVKDFSVPRLYPEKHCKGRKKDKDQDEIRQLADTLDDFYMQIRDGYRKLEEENRHQEIFLRASSHQLKTPIAAALLLVEGMINQVGRYKDTGQYLPRVKEQLLSMRKMVEDILYLNHCTENMQYGPVSLGRLVEEGLGNYQAALVEKRLQVDFEKDESIIVYSDGTVLLQILDNLLSNAVKYTPEGGRIRISMYRERGQESVCQERGGKAVSREAVELGRKTGSREPAELEGRTGSREVTELRRKTRSRKAVESGDRSVGEQTAEFTAGIRIENFGVTIPEELLPHVFEPFVRGEYDSGIAGIPSHGLGLYIADYYAGKLGAALSVCNGKDSVAADLQFCQARDL